ncbi:MAG: hypothetical protein ACYTG7_20125 [Planctomycetota bacterium]|jgi:hypothetical protein
MKKLIALGIPLLLFFTTPVLHADAPELEAGVYIYDGASPLEVDRHSTPTVTDWNNDGAKDLVVGQFGYGRIWLFLNQGTNLNPVFNGGSLIESNGTPIQVSSG